MGTQLFCKREEWMDDDLQCGHERCGHVRKVITGAAQMDFFTAINFIIVLQYSIGHVASLALHPHFVLLLSLLLAQVTDQFGSFLAVY